MSEQFVNSAIAPTRAPDTTLNNGGVLGAGDLALVVSSVPSYLSAAPPPFRIRINNEIILVGTTAGTAWSNLTRGAEGTPAAAHADNSGVYLVLTAQALYNNISNIDGDINVTGDGTIEGDLEVDGELQLFGDLYLNRSPFLTNVGTGTSNILYVRSGDIEFAQDYVHGTWMDSVFDSTTYHGVAGHTAIIDDLYALFIGAPTIGSDLTINNRAWSLGVGGNLQVQGVLEADVYVDMFELAVPATPSAGSVRIYSGNTGGKTTLMALFNTGIPQQIAIEP